MYTHRRTRTHSPSHLRICTLELSEGVRHRRTLGCPDRHTCAVTPKPPLVLCSAPAVGRSPQIAGTLRLWWQPMVHPLKTDLEVLESLSLRRMGDGAQPGAIRQVLSWPPQVDVVSVGVAPGRAATEGWGLLEGTWKASCVLGTRACGVGVAWLGRQVSVNWVHHTVAFMSWISKRNDCTNQTGGK